MRHHRSLLALVLRGAASMAAPKTPQTQLRPAKGSSITFEDIARIPRPGSQGVAKAAFSPDGSHLTYLKSGDGSLTTQLYATDVKTGTTFLAFGSETSEDSFTLSKEEQMRRERARVMATGVTTYAWAKNADVLLVPADGALFVKQGVDGSTKKLFDVDAFPDVGQGPPLDAKLSDDGSRVVFVWNDEVLIPASLFMIKVDEKNTHEIYTQTSELSVCAVDINEGVPRRLTTGARGVEGVTNGVADYCAMEEMDRYEGFWLSPTGNRVCFEQVDETDVYLLKIPRPGDAEDPGAAEEHRYPFSGATNPSVKLGVVGVNGGDVAWLDLTKAGLGEDTYLARVYWASDATVLACVQSRDQRTMRLVAYDIDKGTDRVVLEETNKAWLNLNDCLRWGVVENEVLIASERDGVQHLYVHSTGDGKVLRRLTEGTDCVVEELVDVQNGLVYYLGGDVEPAKCTERHLFSVPYDGSSPPKRVDDAAGVYLDAAAVSKTGAVFLQHSAVDAPVVAELRSASTTILKDAADAPLVSQLKPPEFFEIPSTDGATTLRGAYYAPDASKYGPGPWPTVVSCYGGPHVQFVADKYATMTGDLRAQHLRERGYLVLKVDNRGSKRRGLAFEAAVQNKFGCLEVDDQVAAVEWAVLCGKADPTRVGIFGWSYGGYLSAMCLAKAPMVFRCAVAGAPVAAWDGYDTHYTERYMGTPSSNPEGYKEGDVCTHVKNVEGALLLVHGLVDENVHFRHTARIAQAMVDAGKAYDLLCFPNERHSPRSEKDRAYQEERVFAFLETWLK